MRLAMAPISPPTAPAAKAILRACRAMGPRCMPSVAKARKAPKFCARPDGDGDLSQFLSRIHVEHFQRRACQRMGLGGAPRDDMIVKFLIYTGSSCQT